MRMMTVQELAGLLRVRKSRAYQLCREGLVPCVRIGRQLRIDEDAVKAWIERGGQALPGGWRQIAAADAVEEGRP